MTSRYRKQFLEHSREAIPGRSTHYFQDVEIVDLITGKTVETIEGFSSASGRDAVLDAQKQFNEWVAEREREETGIKPEDLA